MNTVDWRLVEQIGELNPWTYPAVLGNLRVHPGKGTSHSPEYLEERTRRLARLVLHTADVDFEGRSILELGCDCAYWSARAVELGARGVVGVDRSERKLRQAELYFSRNDYLSPESRTFLQGDVSEPTTWERIARVGTYDVTLCVGVLERVEDAHDLLRRAADATRETLVVVTRLAQADRLIDTLIPLGFEGAFEDDLEAGLTAWVARRTGVVQPKSGDADRGLAPRPAPAARADARPRGPTLAETGRPAFATVRAPCPRSHFSPASPGKTAATSPSSCSPRATRCTASCAAASLFNTERIDHLHVGPKPDPRLSLHYGDLSDAGALANLIEGIRPDEVYNLGAQSHVRISFDQPEYTVDVTAVGVIRLLEALRGYLARGGKPVRFYQAGSSEMFGKAPPRRARRRASSRARRTRARRSTRTTR